MAYPNENPPQGPAKGAGMGCWVVLVIALVLGACAILFVLFGTAIPKGAAKAPPAKEAPASGH